MLPDFGTTGDQDASSGVDGADGGESDELRASVLRGLAETADETEPTYVVGDPGSEPGGAIQVDLKVKRPMDGKRLDQYLVDRLPAYSRNIIQKIIEADAVTVNARDAKASYHVKKGDHIRIWLPELNDDAPEP